MKKLILTAAVVMGVAFAVTTADAAMKVSTSSFNTDTIVAFQGTGEFHAAHFSTGSVFDYITVYDSSSTVNINDGPSYRIYNDNIVSTATVSTLGSGVSKGSTVIPVYGGLIWVPSSADYNHIAVIYYR